MKMIESARGGEIDLIYTKSISRFARNTVDTITYVRELRELGVEIIFEKENISSLDPKIDFMLTILSSIAQEESRAISTNVKWAYDKKFKKGIVDARRIYGFDVVDNKFVINQEEAEVIRQIFTLALKRYKPSDIVKTLNTSGIKTLRGGNWSYGTIVQILKNEKYCGDAILRKTVTIDYLTKKQVKNDNIVDKYYVSNNHEAIVTKEMYDSVQIILKDNTVVERNSNKTTKYPLTGIIFCPKCGRSLKRQQVNRGENMRVILNCNHSYGNPFNCDSSSPDYDLVLEATVDAVNEIYANEKVLENLFDVFDNNVALNNLRADVAHLKEETTNLYNLHHEDPENIHIFNQITHNESKLEVLEKELVSNVTTSVRLDYIKSLVAKEHEDESSVNIKDIFTLVLADGKKVTFVISPSKTRGELLENHTQILDDESILRKMYVSRDGKRGIFYEVKLYE
jgi:site-specific DNA recombinase